MAFVQMVNAGDNRLISSFTPVLHSTEFCFYKYLRRVNWPQ
jgi:hypothetical protein